jgi:hypothetical protein
MTKTLAHRIEQICIQGCDSVRQTIESLELHQPVNSIRDLSPQECNEVLHELKEIMSIYDYR